MGINTIRCGHSLINILDVAGGVDMTIFPITANQDLNTTGKRLKKLLRNHVMGHVIHGEKSNSILKLQKIEMLK